MAKPVVLMILDGWGMAEPGPGNAAELANTPILDGLFRTCASSKLHCSGEAVGLPAGQQGNSEVGHLNLGAGRVVYQDLLRIEKDVASGQFSKNDVFNELMAQVLAKDKALHLIGLLSDGGVHSHQDHLYALLAMAKEKGLKKVYIHPFLDGRDVPPDSGLGFIKQLQRKCNDLGIGQIASVCGRYYAMDRDQRWERVEKAWRALVLAEGEKTDDIERYVEACYHSGLYDEFILPTVICDNEENPLAPMSDGDGVIFYNFRADRAREISHALGNKLFEGFKREALPALLMATMTEYEAGMDKWLDIAYPPLHLNNTLGEWLARQGKRQMRTAETEKYAHVTFFFNGGVEAANENEDRCLVPSPKVSTYDLKPEMSAAAVADEVIKAIKSEYDFILVNFANPDMVGHTGIVEAAVAAVEAVDEAIGRIVRQLEQTEGAMLICADHGNCERMMDEKGHPVTSHTTNPVPLLLVQDKRFLAEGALCDVAPTILELMEMPIPEEMTGHSLLRESK